MVSALKYKRSVALPNCRPALQYKSSLHTSLINLPINQNMPLILMWNNFMHFSFAFGAPAPQNGYRDGMAFLGCSHVFLFCARWAGLSRTLPPHKSLNNDAFPASRAADYGSGSCFAMTRTYYIHLRHGGIVCSGTQSNKAGQPSVGVLYIPSVIDPLRCNSSDFTSFTIRDPYAVIAVLLPRHWRRLQRILWLAAVHFCIKAHWVCVIDGCCAG